MKKLITPLILTLSIIFITLITLRHINTINNDNIIKIHYIDVGQGDAILIQVNSINMLIDSGPLDSYDYLITYLNSLNLRTLDYIIATHPHEDHIGAMYKLLDKFKVKNFYAPKVTSDTLSFERMVQSLISKNLKINVLNTNTKSIDLGQNTNIKIFSPLPEFSHDNLNLYSPIFQIQYGSTKFLFTGDSEKETEESLLNQGANLKSDVIKIAHHGSSSSSTTSFLDNVNAKIAVIPVGKDNLYNHPNQSILDRLKLKNTQIYRTDIDNSIIVSSNGKDIYVDFSYK